MMHWRTGNSRETEHQIEEEGASTLPPAHGLLANLGQALHELLPIQIIVVDVLAPVAPAHHVMNRPWIIHAQLT
jgi:hypothetical protein